MTQAKTPSERSDMNLDPITGEPGSHPVGTGAGATGGALAGAAVGAMGGPAGAVAGMLVGAVAGGMGGKAVAERINPTAEHSHWCRDRPRAPEPRRPMAAAVRRSAAARSRALGPGTCGGE